MFSEEIKDWLTALWPNNQKKEDRIIRIKHGSITTDSKEI